MARHTTKVGHLRQPRRRARYVALLLLAISGASMAVAAGATAAPQHNPKGRFLGLVKSARAAQRAAPQAQAQAQLAAGDLRYHQGAVMHSNRTHAIYWEPSGSAFTTTATYKSLINGFLGDIAADSGKHSNVYASDVQYTGTNGNAAYNSTFAGAIVATDPYPASGCSDPGTSVCLTDPQIQAEVDHVVAVNGLPRGLGDLYMVMTPQGVGSCFDSNPADGCAYTDYCAYHSWFGSGSSETLYSNQPYSGDPGCDSDQHPNGNVADATINLISHEHNEAITDPDGLGWWDASGNENGDKCVWNFGTALGSTANGQYNQLIHSHDYYLQQEWSNSSAAHGCVLQMPNAAPSASFTFSPTSPTTGQSVSFNGTGSNDSDGTIAGYSWDFGDGSTGTGATPSHTYAAAGTYTVKLTVTDNDGSKTSVSHSVTVANRPPVAAFTFSPGSPTTGQSVAFDGSGSSDPDGTVTKYSWDFGDGSTDTTTGAKPSHTYATAGTYTVKLTVTDNNNATNNVTHTVTVADRPPVASFTFAPASPVAGESVSFDGSGSSDPDGTVAGYSWDFGDGTTDTTSGAHPSHSYATAGPYTVKLTVTDNNGVTSNVTHTVTVGTNSPPSASFTFSPPAPTSQQSVSFDGSASSDSGGTVTGYSWDFGDGSTDTTTGAKPSHAYAHAGTYTVKLTVTDNEGATNSVTHSVTVADQPPAAAFTFAPASPTTGQSVSFDGTGSSDPDGTVTGYSWDFGDGTTDTTSGANPSHTYPTAGPYTVKLTVTDNNGATNNVTHTVTVADRPPVAAFTFSPSSPAPGQSVSFDGSGSSDPDGSVAAYSWDFGDGATDTTSGAKPSHTYASAGGYTVSLEVTDNSGNRTSVTHQVTVPQSTSTTTPPGGGTSPPAGQSTAAGSAPTLGSTGPSRLGVLPTTGARLDIPAQSLRLSTSRATGVLVRCGSGPRCAGALTVSVTVPTKAHRIRTVTLGRARFSVAALHVATVHLHLARLAATLLSGHQRIRVRIAAAVTNAAAGRAALARSVWLAPAAKPRR